MSDISEDSVSSSQLTSPLLSPTEECANYSIGAGKENNFDETICNELQILVDVATKKFSNNSNSRTGSIEHSAVAPKPPELVANATRIEIDNDLVDDEFLQMRSEQHQSHTNYIGETPNLGNLLGDPMDGDINGDNGIDNYDDCGDDDEESDVKEAAGDSVVTSDEQTDSNVTSQCTSPLLGGLEDTSCVDDVVNA